MAYLYSRTYRFEKAEWYDAWAAHFKDIWGLEYALRKVWGRTPGHGERVKVQIRHDYLLEVTFVGLDLNDGLLIDSVRQVLRNPLPQKPTALDAVDHVLQEPA